MSVEVETCEPSRSLPAWCTGLEPSAGWARSEELGVRRPLLVTDGAWSAGLQRRPRAPYGRLRLRRVRPNPDVELIGRTSEIYREEGCDGLVALGGGSSMDTAKGGRRDRPRRVRSRLRVR